jgi:hypothetical protein
MRRQALLVPAVAALAAAWWYFGVLLARTDFGANAITVANDSLHIMYLTCGGAVGLASFLLIRRAIWPVLGHVLLVAALVPTLGFAWLNLSETVCMAKEAGECISLLSTDYPLISLVYGRL